MRTVLILFIFVLLVTNCPSEMMMYKWKNKVSLGSGNQRESKLFISGTSYLSDTDAVDFLEISDRGDISRILLHSRRSASELNAWATLNAPYIDALGGRVIPDEYGQFIPHYLPNLWKSIAKGDVYSDLKSNEKLSSIESTEIHQIVFSIMDEAVGEISYVHTITIVNSVPTRWTREEFVSDKVISFLDIEYAWKQTSQDFPDSYVLSYLVRDPILEEMVFARIVEGQTESEQGEKVDASRVPQILDTMKKGLTRLSESPKLTEEYNSSHMRSSQQINNVSFLKKSYKVMIVGLILIMAFLVFYRYKLARKNMR